MTHLVPIEVCTSIASIVTFQAMWTPQAEIAKIIEEASVFCAESRKMVARARTQIAANQAFLDATIRVVAIPVLMSCLLCDAESERMHHLVFRTTALARTRATWSDMDMAELGSALNKFGVCEGCLSKYQGQHRRIVVDLNRLLHAVARPSRLN